MYKINENNLTLRTNPNYIKASILINNFLLGMLQRMVQLQQHILRGWPTLKKDFMSKFILYNTKYNDACLSV